MNHLNQSKIFCIAFVLIAQLVLASAAKAQAWLELFGQATINGAIRSIAQDDNKLYVSGKLLSVADQRARGLATFDLDSGTWSPVNLDLGDGFSYMAFYGEGNEKTLFGAGLPDHTLVKIHDKQLMETTIDGSVTGLRSVQLLGLPLLVASGSFRSDDQVFGLAVWNGRQWRYFAELTPYTRQLAVVERGGEKIIYALGADNNVVVEFDGLELVYREVPVLPDVAALSPFADTLAACDRSGELLTVFDGFTWSLRFNLDPNSFGCRNLTSRQFHGRDQLLVGDSQGAWRVFDVGVGNSMALDLPAGSDGFTRSIPAAGQTALVTLSARKYSRQLAIWESNRWLQPEQYFQSQRLKAQVQSTYTLKGKTYVYGQFAIAPESVQSAVGIFSNEGIKQLARVPDQSSRAVMDESGVVYAWTPEGLSINRGQDSVMIEVADVYGGAELALTESGELFVGICNQQLFRLQGDRLTIASELPDNLTVLCNFPVIAIPETSVAKGVYFMAAQPPFNFDFGRGVSVWRFDGTELIDVSPPALTGFMANPRYLPQVSSITINDSVFPALSFDKTVTYFDGRQWITLPAVPEDLLPIVGLSGPVVTAKVGSEPCFFAAARTQLIQFCNDQWSTSDTLSLSFLNTIDLILQPGIQTMIASEFQGRPVLLVGGSFDAAGRSTQSATAVLDLDVILNDSFEF